MEIPKKDLKIEFLRGKGPGGQHKNKTDSMVRVTHKPTGVVVTVDGRCQHSNRRKAMKELVARLRQRKADRLKAAKKACRDWAIHNTPTIRTYNYKSGVVRDHRTKKTAPLKEVMDKGNLELLR